MLPKRVIVVGAGRAGLAAALELARAHLEIIVIEARPRPRGRVWTERDAFAGGQHGELGGEFIDSDDRRMRRLAARTSHRRMGPAGGPGRSARVSLLSPLCWLGGALSRASAGDRVAWVSWEQEPFTGGGYMEGAVQSGADAARKLLKRPA